MLHYSAAFVTLADQDGVTLTQFYSRLLNQAPAPHIPNVYAEFQLPGLRLGIFKPSANHQLEFDSSSSGGMSLCFEVPDLEAAIAHLKHLGYPPPGDIAVTSHGREIYAYDPAGNRLILHQAIATIAILNDL